MKKHVLRYNGKKFDFMDNAEKIRIVNERMKGNNVGVRKLLSQVVHKIFPVYRNAINV